MESALHDILINTYNPNHDLRVAAEKALQQFLVTPGSLTALINFIGNTSVHRELRQASGLVLKNRLRDYFYVVAEDPQLAIYQANNIPVNDGLPTSPEEKEYVKHQIVNILLGELDNSIRGMLAEGIRVISEFEYPHRWPNLVPTLLANIQNNDVLRIYNALLALRKLAKRYEYKNRGKDREPFNEMLQLVFPVLQGLLTHILHHNSTEAAQVMRICFKVFWSATVYILPLGVQGIDVNLWFSSIAEVMNKRLPEGTEGVEPAGQPSDPYERKQWPWWKLKKWTSRIMTHFIQRYGNPRYCCDEDKPFANFFRESTSISLLGPAMNNLQWKAKGQFLTEDVHRHCLTYLNNCSEMSPTYKIMKPHLQFILFEAVFPSLCVTPEDVELFNDDPQEFVRKIHNPLQDWLSPMVAASTLLQSLARYRQKDILPLFLPFLQKILEEYNQTHPDKRDYAKKDGVFVAIASLIQIMKDTPTYRPMLIPFLQHHVLSEFKSPVAFLRARACWVIEYFSVLDWEQEAQANIQLAHLPVVKKKAKGKKGSNKEQQLSAGEILQNVLQSLVSCLRDPATPVQAAAACSIQALIQKEGATELLRPFLPQIIEEYFRIMEEVENESVLLALQGIVEQYGDEIAHLAPRMIDHLVRKFQEYSAEDGDDEEAQFNALQCLDTIDSILQCLEDQEEVLKQIEPGLLPFLMHLLNSDGDCIEYIDSAVHVISCYTYFYDEISPAMWQVCGPLVTAFSNWALDYASEIMVPLLNYITKGANIFLQAEYEGKKIVGVFFEALGKCYNEHAEGYSGRDYNSCSNLLTCLIIAAKETKSQQLFNPYLPNILHLILEKLATAKAKSVIIRMLEVVMASFYYDANLTLQILCSIQSSAITTKLAALTNKPVEEYLAQGPITTIIFFFHLLFDHLKDMDRDFTERLIVLSFLSILSLPSHTLPEIVQLNIPSMFQQIIREIVIIEEEAKKAAEEGDDDEDEEDEDEFDEDDDDYDGPDRTKDHSLRQIDADEDEDEEFDDSDPVLAAKNRKAALHVPEGGYDENEDCINVQDEEYRQALEGMDEEDKIKRQKFMNGEPVDDEDEEDDFIYTSPIENIAISSFFMLQMNEFLKRDQQQSTQFTTFLKQNLVAEDQERLGQIMQMAQEQLQQQQQQQAQQRA